MTHAVLLWRPEEVNEGDWRRLEPAPATNEGFFETKRYLFRAVSSSLCLYVDDEPLRFSIGQHSTWEWQPGFFAGEVTAELRGAHDVVGAMFLLDVAPDPSKLGRTVFEMMMRELWDEDPTFVIGDEPATSLSGEMGQLEDPWIAFARLRRYAPEFLSAVMLLRQSLLRTLRVRRDSAPLYHARRVDQKTAISILRSPAVSLFWSDTDVKREIPAESRIDVPIIEETVDSAANRAIFALIRAVLHRAGILLKRLQASVDREVTSTTRTALAGRWPARRQALEMLILQFGALLRQSPFTQVSRPEVSAAGLTAIAADPIYSRAWGRGWRAMRHGVESERTTERLWVSPSWEIYERWCFLRIGKLLAQSLPGRRWTLDRYPRRWRAVSLDEEVELRLQPKFSAQATPTEGMWSISRERVPDLLLTVQRPGCKRFMILDAKYRTSRQYVLEAMESAHIYQDSLRINRSRPDATLLVVPSTRHISWLADRDFQAEHRVGAWALLPGEENTLPAIVLDTLLGSDLHSTALPNS